MNHSEQMNEIASALIAAQSEMSLPRRNRKVTVKTKTGGNYEFEYTTLDAIIEHIRQPLTKNGLWFTQTLANGDGKYKLVTMLMHKSGQWVASETPLMPNGNGNQEFGSALTYMKRYALSAMLGIASDDDDDGNAADGNHISARQDKNGNGASNYGKITADQAQTIRDMLADSKRDPEKFCQYFRIKAVTELSATDFPRAIEALNTTLHPKGAPRPSQHEH